MEEPAPEGPEASGPPSSPLRWPPPGLERIQGDLWTVSIHLLAGGGLLAIPFLWALGAGGDPDAALRDADLGGPFFQGGWWILLLTTLVSLAILAHAFTGTVRLLRRWAKGIREGYGWRTVALVAADRSRDTGFLLQGVRAFSTLSAEARTRLLHVRILHPGSLFAAGFWLPTGLVLALLLASRGILSTAGGVATLTLLPAALALGGAIVLSLWNHLVCRRARKRWHQGPWSQDLGREEIREWTRGLAGVVPAGKFQAPSSKSPRLLSAAAGLVAAVGIGVAAITFFLVSLSSGGSLLLLIAAGPFASTQERAARAEAFRPYVLNPDPSVTPQEAGEALQALVYAGSDPDPSAGELPPVREYPDSWIRGDAENPTGLPPAAWPTELFSLVGGELDAGGLEFLREIAAHPGLAEFRLLARAPEVDVGAARWERPLPPGMNVMSLPIPRLRAFRDAARVQIARAAVELHEGRAVEAEEALLELLSAGFRLGENGTILIDNLAGHSVAGMAGEALASFYLAAGREEEADRLREAMDLADRSVERAGVGLERTTAGARPEEVRDLVTDTSLLRGIRWEHFMGLNTFTPCGNLRRIVLGPDPAEHERWIEEARESLVRWPSEEEIFALARHGYFGTAGGDGIEEDPGWILRLLTWPMADGPGSCSALLRALGD